jgi:hypothetical protein
MEYPFASEFSHRVEGVESTNLDVVIFINTGLWSAKTAGLAVALGAR